jgi:hypothetical protein
MSTCIARTTTEHPLDSLVRSAMSAGAPARVAEEARRITEARFGSGQARARRERLESYFWGVVRRRALSGGAPAIARLLVAASLASELAEAGHTSDAIARAIS